jgi:hypothetical protein
VVRWSATASRTAWFGVHIRAGLELADREDLVPGANSDGEGAGAAAQEGIGAGSRWGHHCGQAVRIAFGTVLVYY